MLRLFCLLLLFGASRLSAEGANVEIIRDRLADRIRGGWTGMLIGGIEGLAHEFKYTQEPRAELPDFPFLPNGARSDDDNDFEWTHLYFMDKHGVLKLPYERSSTSGSAPALVEIWKANMNTGLWCANLEARKLMDKGIVPPQTANPASNSFAAFNLSGQFAVESYGLIAPGMPRTAADIAVHYASVAVSGEPLEAARYWATLMSLATVSGARLEELMEEALRAVSPESAQADAVLSAIQAYRDYPQDWKAARKRFHDRWYVPKEKAWDATAKPLKWNDNSTPLNGAMVVLALLYGKGDFYQTGQHAMALGYDADCNAATACAVVGARVGYSTISKLPGFAMPDRYVNKTRPELPKESKISEQAELILRLAEQVILENGGKKEERRGRTLYRIQGQTW